MQSKIKSSLEIFVRLVKDIHNSEHRRMKKDNKERIEENKNVIQEKIELKSVLLDEKLASSKPHDSDKINDEKDSKGQHNLYNEEEIAYAKQLSKEYVKSRLNHDETNETVSLVQAYQPTANLASQGYKFVTNQSIHVRCAYYIDWYKKAMFYQQLMQQKVFKGDHPSS